MLLAMVAAPASWRLRAGIVVVAGVLPVGYQIFRMGYYALLVPNPAVAKDASGSSGRRGFDYVGNLFSPYLLVLPLILLIVVAVVLGVDGRLVRGPVQGEVTGLRERAAGWSARLQSPTG